MNVLRWLDKNIESFILVVLSILAVVVVFAQVFMRKVVGSSLVWSEELARYAFIWIIYIGVSYAVKRQAHISVDAINLVLGRMGKFIFAICANIAVLAFAVILSYYSFEVVLQITRISPAMGLSMKLVYAAPMVGLLLTAIRVVQQMKIQVDTFRLGE